MYDTGKITVGITIFVIIVLSPLWYNAIRGRTGYIPELKRPVHEKECVEPASYMRTNHVDLLTRWKESVVRAGERTYRAGNGKTHAMSLVGTCMRCHSNKSEFCDRCHVYANVQPQCWNCHVEPRETKSEAMRYGR